LLELNLALLLCCLIGDWKLLVLEALWVWRRSCLSWLGFCFFMMRMIFWAWSASRSGMLEEYFIRFGWLISLLLIVQMLGGFEGNC
jgi:hypothetical protein